MSARKPAKPKQPKQPKACLDYPETLYVLVVHNSGDDADARLTFNTETDLLDAADHGDVVAVYTLTHVGKASVKRMILP